MVSILFLSSGTEYKKTRNINGDSIRFGGNGASGTEQSIISVAEQLASKNFTVTFAIPHVSHKLVCRGVNYFDLTREAMIGEYDVLVVTGWFMRFDLLNKVTIKNAVCIWFHSQFYLNKHLIDNLYSEKKKYMVHISEWSRISIMGQLQNSDALKYKHALIHNPLIKVDLDNNIKREHKIIFHALWTRGGSVAERVAKKLNMPMFKCDYNCTKDEQCESSFDKKTLYTRLQESEYFVYPLVEPNGNVHRDTHACVVAEAMANGVIVITYPIAALKTSYPDDCIVYADFPKGCKVFELESCNPIVHDDSFLSEEAINNLCDKIIHLESNPILKEQIRERAIKYVWENFDETKIGNDWYDKIGRHLQVLGKEKVQKIL
jgi:hypothetical protein